MRGDRPPQRVAWWSHDQPHSRIVAPCRAARPECPSPLRWWKRRYVGASCSSMAADSALCGLASSMPLLALARIVQGGGAGGAYTVALAAVTRIYPASSRARVLALLAGAWIVPGLLGPSYGALMASTLGWRWAFIS